ncbi:hypothetical protein LCGC14_1122420 [marine sediment metagenome]|uniref:DUF1257 domain-containing protein n=1 Tax=marine sediment metagenome TaxID=412755 RepID=A0A0F9M3K1_9ZZZZ
MSHFTKVVTKIFDKEILISTLKKLKYSVFEGKLKLTGYEGQKRNIDILVKLKGSYDIGFARNKDGSFSIIADWWGVTNVKKEEFTRMVNQNYSLNMIRREMKKKGYKIVKQTNLEDKSIKVVVRKW